MEIQNFCPETPFILVGTKMDMREAKNNPKNKKLTTKEEAITVGTNLGAAEIMECSAMTQAGLKDVFDKAIQVALHNRANERSSGRTRRKCNIL